MVERQDINELAGHDFGQLAGVSDRSGYQYRQYGSELYAIALAQWVLLFANVLGATDTLDVVSAFLTSKLFTALPADELQIIAHGVFVVSADIHINDNDVQLLVKRDELYRQAKAENPFRWSGNTCNCQHTDVMTFNPDDETDNLEKAV